MTLTPKAVANGEWTDWSGIVQVQSPYPITTGGAYCLPHEYDYTVAPMVGGSFSWSP